MKNNILEKKINYFIPKEFLRQIRNPKYFLLYKPFKSGEFLLNFGVFRPSLKFGDAKSWLGLPSAWNELQSSEVGVTEPGLKKVSNPSPKSCEMASVTSPGFNRGLVGALVFARRGRPKHKSKENKDVLELFCELSL